MGRDLMTRLEKGTTLRSQREILPSTLDELDTKTTFQSAHLLAYSALRDAVHLGRLGETRGFRQIGYWGATEQKSSIRRSVLAQSPRV
jgi:hypothetical protein